MEHFSYPDAHTGLDLNHNPEFTTCESYRAYYDIESLMNLTEDLFFNLRTHIKEKFQKADLPQLDFKRPFKRIDFISGIEAATNRKLPNLALPTATNEVIEIFHSLKIPLPLSTTLPVLLDKLSGIYLEPQCSNATFIINHPECLSPLSKTFIHPTTNQQVAARAELFVNQQEVVNTYEEENSPTEQRKKFVEQLKYRDDEEDTSIDESYLEALEWGLPPTGGWGCGIDRLSMLMSGATRIGDVLSFGSLRNVVSLRTRKPAKHVT